MPPPLLLRLGLHLCTALPTGLALQLRAGGQAYLSLKFNFCSELARVECMDFLMPALWFYPKINANIGVLPAKV